jgi:hypothetical protein
VGRKPAWLLALGIVRRRLRTLPICSAEAEVANSNLAGRIPANPHRCTVFCLSALRAGERRAPLVP